MKIEPIYLIAGGVLAAAFIYVATRPKGWAADTGFKAGEGTFDLVDGAIGGFGQSLIGLVGVPKTDQTECEKAKAEGRTWDASFACDAQTFIKYLVD